jgi:hypothetical protein
MRNWIISIKYLYRECIVYNLVFTFVGADLLIKYGASSHSSIFWVKVVGYGFISLVYYWNRKKYLYFFHNLNLNRRNLIITAVGIDTLITIIILFTVNIFFN